MQTFTEITVTIIKSIPRGKVATYGQIAALAGSPNGARQVVRILNTCSKKYKLPWWRVLSSKGKISLTGEGYFEQKGRLLKEKIKFDNNDLIDFDKFLWKPQKRKSRRRIISK
jgi:methylated-DNA-protein-cysteine methyltransferase-like protein